MQVGPADRFNKPLVNEPLIGIQTPDAQPPGAGTCHAKQPFQAQPHSPLHPKLLPLPGHPLCQLMHDVGVLAGVDGCSLRRKHSQGGPDWMCVRQGHTASRASCALTTHILLPHVASPLLPALILTQLCPANLCRASAASTAQFLPFCTASLRPALTQCSPLQPPTCTAAPPCG